MTSQHPVAVSFDYGCPFSYLAHRWLLDAGADVDFQPFSLAELHRTPGTLPPWQVPVDQQDPVVLSLATHELVRNRGGDLVTYRTEMFSFWHEETHRTLDGLLGIMERHVGEPVTAQMTSEGLAALRSSHEEAASEGTFGTPTLRFGDGRSFFLKLSSPPADADGAAGLWRHISALVEEQPTLLELKRVTND